MRLIRSPLLIIIGEEHGRYAAVGFGDNPEFHAVRVVIDGKEAVSVRERPLVFGAVVGADIAPIAARVMRESRCDIIGAERVHRVSGHHHLAERNPAATDACKCAVVHRRAE